MEFKDGLEDGMLKFILTKLEQVQVQMSYRPKHLNT